MAPTCEGSEEEGERHMPACSVRPLSTCMGTSNLISELPPMSPGFNTWRVVAHCEHPTISGLLTGILSLWGLTQ